MFDKNIGMYFDSFLTISVPLIILVFYALVIPQTVKFLSILYQIM